MKFRRFISCAIGLLAVLPICGSQPLFRLDRLEKMAAAMGTENFASIKDGEHYAMLRYNGLPVTVIAERGVVQHIGYSFFTPSMRDAIGLVVSSFLERYALEADLPLPQEKELLVRQMEDGVSFIKGNLSSLKAFCSDTTLAVDISCIGSRMYRFTCPVADMAFPADHQLLLGRDQIENEARLPGEISSCDKPARPAQAAEDTFYIEQLVSRFYYDAEGVAIDEASRPTETLANMLGGAIPSGNLTALIKMNCYGFTHRYFEVPLWSLVSYGIGSGCTPYLGLIREDGDEMEYELVLKQAEAGYAHVLRLWIPHKSLATKEGKVQMRLTPFIPMHSLRYLFEETRQ